MEERHEKAMTTNIFLEEGKDIWALCESSLGAMAISKRRKILSLNTNSVFAKEKPLRKWEAILDA